ncbi:MAG: GNAT family N-acetyltransferase [Muribaculaceae bacterium]|nr:GNAT family N-acetyltransferase [Muribaculaceae bacterium]
MLVTVNKSLITFSRVTNLSESVMQDCYYVIAQALPHLADEFYYRAQHDVNHDNHIMFIAETPCMVVGLIKGCARKMPDAVHAQIDCLAVDRKFRRGGIGEKLLRAYEEYVRTERNAICIGLQSSAGALDFYTNRSYVRGGDGPYMKKTFSR